MNRHSVFFKLNILFIVALLATLIAGSSIVVHIGKKDRMDMLFKSRLIMKEHRIFRHTPTALFEEFHMTPIEGNEKQKILKDQPMFPRQDALLGKRSHTLAYKGHMYLHIHTPHMNVLLRDDRTLWDRFYLPILAMLGTMILLITMYILLRKTLSPLRKLQDDIVRYGEGVLTHYALSSKKDEIALVSNAFYKAASKSKRLTESRTLFIRNLFHELNTPVTKGKILTEIVDEPKTKTMLDSIFSRLASLLKELAQMEQITSENYALSPKPVRIIELIHEAADLLYLDEPLNTNVTTQMMKADFASMSIVFKNLIDNALKYGKNLEIIYDQDSLAFISEGVRLDGDFKAYLEAFSPQHDGKDKGFGLGLYIVNEILSKHGMGFEYDYKEDKNRFTINFKNNL